MTTAETEDLIHALSNEVSYCRNASHRMRRAGYVNNAADYTIWADNAQSDLDALTAAAPRWTSRQVLEVAASVVFAEAVFSAVLWAAVLR